MTVIMLAGLGSFSHTSKRDDQVNAGPPVPVPQGGAAQHPKPKPPLGPGPPAPRTGPEQQLQSTLSGALQAAGPQSGAFVYDLDARDSLFARRIKVGRPPASVEKLYTTVALLRILGPNARLHTDVLGTGRLAHGVWHGNLYLRGGGDPTFGDQSFNQVWEHGYGSNPNELVNQLKAKGIRRVTGWVYADESLFDRRRGGLMTNYAPDTPDYGGQMSALTYDHGSALKHVGPAEFAVREFVLTMRGGGIAARAAKRTATTPPQARLLAIVNSPPMWVMTRLMDVPSDDLFADLFAKQLGVLFGKGGTLSAGAHVIGSTIAAQYRLHPRILDGSGLSRNDRTSPLEIVDLLREVWHTPIGDELGASLPTVGVNGTVQTVGLKTAAVRRCIAKTGTLNNVTNLAGYCQSRSGHTLAFGFFIDGPPNWTAITLESRMIGAVARY
ncbi:MAG: D-alanyl-D-alanine carboxypeptidase/D-alanyl-D-alanine-endopeptidase [Solirubrobacteraceae bacterium]